MTTAVGKLNTTERKDSHLQRQSMPLAAERHPLLAVQLPHFNILLRLMVEKELSTEQFPQPMPLGQSLGHLSCYYYSVHSPSAQVWCQDNSTNFTQYYCLHYTLRLTWVICKWSCAKKIKICSKDCRTNFKELLSGRRDGSEVKMERV